MGRRAEPTARASRAGAGRRVVAGLVLALLLLLPACGEAAGRLWLDDGAALLNGARVEAAAEPLRARGATVAVVVVASGDDTGADFARRLDRAGLLAGQEIVPDGIAVYVSRTPRYSELRVGRRWSGVIDRERLAAIRRELLNPPLSAGDITVGVVAALQAVEERLAVAGASGGVPWTMVGPVAGALAVVAVAAAWFWRRHQRLAGERRRLARATERLTATCRAVADAATEARAAVESATRLKPCHQQEYQGRLRRLDQRRARLEEQTPPPTALPDDLVALVTSYRTLTEAVRFSLASLTMTASELKHQRRRRAQPPAGARYSAAGGAAASEPDDSAPSSYSSDPPPLASGGGSESRDGGEY